MSDTKYEFGNVPGRYFDRVQRAAVLHEIFGPHVVQDEQVRRKVKHLIQIWRTRLSELVQAGWQPKPGLDEAGIYQRIGFMRNCHPTFVFVEPMTRCCQLDYLCPFCYARSVGKFWQRLVAFFPREDAIPSALTSPRRLILSGDPAARRPYDVLIREKRAYWGFTDDPAHVALAQLAQARRPGEISLGSVDHNLAQHWLRANLQATLKRRRQIMERIPSVAALCSYGLTLRPTCWMLSSRQLFVLEPEQALPPEFQQDTRLFQRYVAPGQRQLYLAVARLLKYPKQLLQGDPRLTVALLNARRGLRLTTRYGEFRNTFSQG